MTLILEVRDLEKAFGGVPVLRGVSFKLFAGQVVALAGENGAGKSTIFKIITGQLKPDSGEVLVDGSVLSKIDSKAAREAGIAIVPQELATFPDMRVYENLFIGREIKNSFGILNRPEMISKSQEMLSVFGLELDSRVKNQ
jgi:ribose transport system ATP-binding protein